MSQVAIALVSMLVGGAVASTLLAWLYRRRLGRNAALEAQRTISGTVELEDSKAKEIHGQELADALDKTVTPDKSDKGFWGGAG